MFEYMNHSCFNNILYLISNFPQIISCFAIFQEYEYNRKDRSLSRTADITKCFIRNFENVFWKSVIWVWNCILCRVKPSISPNWGKSAIHRRLQPSSPPITNAPADDQSSKSLKSLFSEVWDNFYILQMWQHLFSYCGHSRKKVGPGSKDEPQLLTAWVSKTLRDFSLCKISLFSCLKFQTWTLSRHILRWDFRHHITLQRKGSDWCCHSHCHSIQQRTFLLYCKKIF